MSASAATIPSYDDVRAAFRTSETTVVDRHGEPIHVVRTDPRVRKLEWATLSEVSPALRTALVLSEDRRFYEHAGVDWRAVGAAAWANLFNTRTRGASTITMQLAGLLQDDLRATTNGRSLAQKLDQGATALALERSWKKDQILEAYLNLVAFRGEVVGVGALSETLFDKAPDGLDAREAAIAAALVRGPNATASRIAARACGILEAQRLDDECRGLDAYAESLLVRRSAKRLSADRQLALHFARFVMRRETTGTVPASIATTIDARLQRFARSTLRTQLAELAHRNVEDGALVVLDNASGDVLAWVGSSGDLSSAADVDHVLAPRQAGSTLKPFLYELAIEKRWLTAASILDDSPVDLATAGGLYIPQNYDHDFKGPVSVRTALASSLNVPAVRTLVIVGPERFHQRLRALGLTTLRESGDYYGYALALGSAEVSLLQLTNAYRALALQGLSTPVRVRQAEARVDVSRSTRVMQAEASAVVADILSDRNARAMTFGMDSVLATRGWSAVKTGTSKDMRDNWCIGFTDRYTVGVWVGNSSGAAMRDVSGTTGAAPVWRGVVGFLERPDGTVRRAVHIDRTPEAPRNASNPTSRLATHDDRSSRPASIATPTDGTIFALDPDIPAARQRVRFRVTGDADAVTWRLDGRPLGRGSTVSWALWPGRHRLEVVGADGATLDAVTFDVRGASARTNPARR